MYDDLMHDLHNLLLSIHSAVLSGRIEQGGVLANLIHSFGKKIDIIFFLTDFQKKNFVGEWCDQHKEEVGHVIEMAKDVVAQLRRFGIDNPILTVNDPILTEVVTFDELRENLVLANHILEKMISDMRE